MTNPTDPWHERWMRLKEYVEAEKKLYISMEEKNVKVGYLDWAKQWNLQAHTAKEVLSEMARLEKEE
jgi:hypothetical protein